MNQKELAAALGIDKSQCSRLVKRGMPMDIAGALAWREEHLRLSSLNEVKREVAALHRARYASDLGREAEQHLRGGRLPEPHLGRLRAALREVHPVARSRVSLPIVVWHALTWKFQRMYEREQAAGLVDESVPGPDCISEREYHAIIYCLASGECTVRP